MASIHEQPNPTGLSWRVKWRHEGKQTSLSFEARDGAERFKANIERYGAAEALRILDAEAANAKSMTVTEFLTQHIDSLTGVQPATLERYRSFLSRDITPAFGSIPLIAVSEDTIGRWVQAMPKETARKTVQNKQAFLSGAFKQAVRLGYIPSNPCEGRRLAETAETEKVYLTPDEFEEFVSYIPQQRYRHLAAWLVLTGMRFAEATALTPSEIDAIQMTCRIWQSWKYTGRHKRVLGPPKSKAGTRTISLSEEALAVIDLTQPEWLFTSNTGNVVSAQDFFNRAWKPARLKAKAAGFKKSHVRVHDLRHTNASWMIQAGIPLPVVQASLGHENIHTTISTYYHLDQRQKALAAQAVGNLLRNSQKQLPK